MDGHTTDDNDVGGNDVGNENGKNGENEFKLVNDYVYSLFSNGKIPFETYVDKMKEIKFAFDNGTSIFDVRK